MKRFNPFDIYGKADRVKDDLLENYSRNANLGNDLPDSRFSSTALKLSVNYRKVRAFYIILAICLAIIFFRTFWLQLVEGASFLEISEGNRIRIQTVEAPRGVIYDREGTLLVRNISNFVLSLIPADLPENPDERKQITKTVATILGVSSEEINEALEEAPLYSYEPIEIQEQIEYEKALLLQIESSSLAGVTLNVKGSREYLEPNSTTHLIGYTGKITEEELESSENNDYLLTDTIGKTGIEYQYENTLKGVDGKKRIEVDSLGKEKKVVASQESQSGKNLTLTINLGLQKILNESLSDIVERTGSPGGAAVALDPRNGEILALVSIPSYDNNKFVKGLSPSEFQELLNDSSLPLFVRPIAGQYPSGSTIKPVIAAAALEEGIITPNTTILSTGGIKAGPSFFPDWKAGGHGSTDVRKAIAESVNTFFYTIGGGFEDFTGLGLEKINEYARLFGLGEPLGIDLPGEEAGFLPTKQWKEETKKERWYLGDTYHLAIGQGDILVTPLQVASYTATIANGGTLFQPHLVQSVYDPQTTQKTTINPSKVRADFIQSSYLKVVSEGLRQAVTSGSAKALNTLSVQAAGKTGTAQFGDDEKTHAWFTGFAPFESPEISITVIVEEGGEGHAAALPVAKRGLEWYFSQNNL